MAGTLWNTRPDANPEEDPLKGLEFRIPTEAENKEFDLALKRRQDNCPHDNVDRYGPSAIMMPWGYLRWSDSYFCRDCMLDSEAPIGKYAVNSADI